MSNKLTVVITSPKDALFSGDALAFTGFNTLGEFDILPGHANFISVVSKKLVLDKDTPHEKTINFDMGIVRAIDNYVEVYIKSVTQ